MDYIIFILLAPLAALALVRTLISVWPFRRLPAARLLGLAGFIIAGWLLFNTVEVLAPTPASKLLWAKLTYIFIAPAPMSWLAFTLVYTNRGGWLSWRNVLLLLCMPAVALLLLFMPGGTEWMWESYHFYAIAIPSVGWLPDSLLGFTVLHGPAYWVLATYSYACLGVSSMLMVQDQFRAFELYRRQSVWALVAILVPLAANLVYLSGLVPGLEKDFTPVAFALGAWIFAVMIRRYGFLDLKPFARTILIENMRDGMLVVDEADRIVDFNRQAASMLALDDMAIGRGLAETLQDGHQALLAYLDGSHEGRTECRLMAGSEERYYEVRVSPLADVYGRVAGRLITLHDITVQEEQKEALRKTNLRLESECEELDAFAHTVAHDLQNPVHTILGFGDLLEQDFDELPEDMRREVARTITRTASKMQQIIRELLLLASVRRQPIEPVPVSMIHAVAEAMDRLQAEITDRGARVTVPEVWPEVLGYGPWIEEVWMNYVGNALKYAGPEPEIELGYTLAEGGQARFWVRDSGAGVPIAKQGQLFIPFSRVGQPKATGNGLGLSIVRRILETLGGGFGVESSGVPGEGSTFYFTLPLSGAVGSEEEGTGTLSETSLCQAEAC